MNEPASSNAPRPVEHSPETTAFFEAVARIGTPAQAATAMSSIAIDAYLIDHGEAINAAMEMVSPSIKPKLQYHIDDVARSVEFLERLRNLSTALSVALEREIRREAWYEVARLSIEHLELATIASRDAFVLNVLSGVGLINKSLQSLVTHRAQFSPDLVKAIVAALMHYDNQLESFESIAARDDDWERVVNKRTDLDGGQKSSGSSTRETARRWYLGSSNTMRLLATDLILRRYFAQHQRYPASLAEIQEDFFPEVPRDSYVGLPFRYRLTEDGFELYSVGPQGADFGGIRGTRSNVYKGLCDHFLDA
ncbi:hypothetical protein Psta_3832 [Pirellula staleyi DSM 6068]|uniref:Uncharacterized protein n=1 Tax=Pirellula staleyi (strain ATCC 27377 / DSM 6068 / ICPB 4128) TaxID=530564 RepID=D2R102_PIRSD|nr:hypothetical protein [Pirellula staleyi]ADB18487.1 hypothetical protein Psta_3832 [Pirellula staleyi DSM 6068]